MGMTVKQVQEHLRAIGWDHIVADGSLGPRTSQAIANFQNGYTGEALVVDGKAGPRTQAALVRCARDGGKASRSFTFRAFVCKCGGSFASCERIKVDRDLLFGLEDYKVSIGGGTVRIVSGYRCPGHNKAVGSMSNSQHLYGTAADFTPVQGRTTTARLRRFSGIGFDGSTGRTRHADVRHAGPNNTTGGTPAAPTIWRY